MEWIMSNAGTIVVGVLLLGAVRAAMRSVKRDLERGGCAGCGGCSGKCSGNCSYSRSIGYLPAEYSTSK